MPSKEQQIKTIIAEILCVNKDKIIPQASIVDDLGADSLDEVEIIMALEDELDISIPDHEAKRMKTFKDVVKYVEEIT